MTEPGSDTRRSDWAAIRPYRPSDRDAVRRVFRVTAFRNRGARAIFGNEDVFADYWTRYYTDFESDLTFVAEREGSVVGYLLGCRDARRHAHTMAWRIVPPLIGRIVADLVRGRHRDSAMRRYVRWAVLWSWRETLPVPVANYPAHYHINVERRGQDQRLYSRLSLAFHDALVQAGGDTVHGLLTEPQRRGPMDMFVSRFRAAHPDARVLSFERPTRFGRDVLGVETPMVNRAYCFVGRDFRRLMEWIGPRYGS
jgi:hypothetical protein